MTADPCRDPPMLQSTRSLPSINACPSPTEQMSRNSVIDKTGRAETDAPRPAHGRSPRRLWASIAEPQKRGRQARGPVRRKVSSMPGLALPVCPDRAQQGDLETAPSPVDTRREPKPSL